jgi:hypothetical protein
MDLVHESCWWMSITDLSWRRRCVFDGFGCRLVNLCKVELLELLEVAANNAHTTHVLSDQVRK